ncbi:hypothetical protein [aff. Roholtiella sp. LEGE 12411]|uniref:hypothetical protein n=1 Tax=aff. Roholtiella sp. LEGE 12411 TaxID=1828822 RepID=UPI001882361F|nr:hypothetical protein [aff. Roholtiella sp. LEGE 12411]MBE9037204.1 hypothetical protein [aff. Roholtiella sp. LEGE 12411]
MTYQTYSQQALSRYTLPRLKRIAAELGVTPTLDKRTADTWINAIIAHQSAQLHKVDEQATAQAQVIAPEELRTVEISFYDHEFFALCKLIASITHDDDLTQPWVVMVEGKEKFRANTWARCQRFIQWHHQDEMLNEPTQAQTETPCTSENRIMAHIFNECQKYDLELLDDGIYENEVKLGQVGCTEGNWWVKKGSSGQQQYSNSVFDAMRTLSMADTSLTAETSYEYLQDRPLEQLNTEELQQLLDAEVAECEQLLDRPVDELTPQDWQQLREYEPVAA